ncbi:MAG: type II secretion system protein GspD [Waddliaceae bacterium]|jgi:general secretion pathway protein D|nr:type II secretion system protein GspD [Waddliaceae bacterium]MBT3579620.1 type II secretion system protein GspD [Waddliaceae bacterium]MBT4444614.1 type II secretion system protein GspD [Waddliaceae bacterium]MBT6928135.1 type II secretion system protein GspD [Waddliaceae bacterium]MBT7264697.1 type II secretion system protein GspD [Waddliaceae bacterium]
MKTTLQLLIIVVVTTIVPLHGQSIAEKKAYIHNTNTGLDAKTQKLLEQTNDALIHEKEELLSLYNDILELHENDASPEEYKDILDDVNNLKSNIKETQESWQQHAAISSIEEDYSLWHQPETTLKQLVIDYGSQDYVYLVPHDIGDVKLSINSNLPVPRESWNEMLAFILTENGIGIKQLNPYLRELFIINKDRSRFAAVTSSRADLNILPPHSHICYILSPKTPDPYTAFDFLSRFINVNNTSLEILGHSVFIAGTVDDISELLKLYDFVDNTSDDKEYKLITLTRAASEDIVSVLETIFHESSQSGKINRTTLNGMPAGLKIIPLNKSSHQSVFLFGSIEEINHAQDIIYDIESRIEGTQEKNVFVYTCKHSDPEDIAPLIEKAYHLLIDTGASLENTEAASDESAGKEPYSTFKGSNALVINPNPIAPERSASKNDASKRDNFIVDPQTGSIIMVVERTVLPMLKDLIKKLDIPKKMVHIEVLLFEKKVTDSNHFGLNILRIGNKATGSDSGWASFSSTGNVSYALDSSDLLSQRTGIFDFFMSRKKRGIVPSYDFAYNFLISQRDITVHSSPSVTTINQTPASIKLVEEISVNTGAISNDNTTETTYSRNQYGITIEITPTVHEPDDFNGDIETFISLDTNITFDDTPSTSSSNQPDITRRNIKNQVRIANGQTVILGGLRRKNSDDIKESMPFLGEIPGIGKLFGETRMSGSSTEMFVFITPTVISDSQEDIMRMQQQELKWRPGDNTTFLTRLLEAKQYEKKRLFKGSLEVLMGRPKHETIFPEE